MSKRVDKTADLRPDRANANRGTERGRYMIEQSLREVGAGRSIVADRHGEVVVGNKTLEVWAEMGGEIEVVHTTGDRLVVVQRDDLDLSDTTGPARKMAYWDNRTQAVDLEFDPAQMLADLQAGVDLSAMFFDNEIDDILMAAQMTEIGDAGSKEKPGLHRKTSPVRVVFAADEVRDLERALRATGIRERAGALLEICRFYLETSETGQLYAAFESVIAA